MVKKKRRTGLLFHRFFGLFHVMVYVGHVLIVVDFVEKNVNLGALFVGEGRLSIRFPLQKSSVRS